MINNIKTCNTKIYKGTWLVLFNLLLGTIASSTIYGQTPVNTFEHIKTFQFQTTQGSGGTDVWGWTANDGTEYALMGVYKGIAVVNATTLDSITVVPGPSVPNNINWRDIKTYKHYAFAVSESRGENEGLMVIDLQFLPDSVKFIGSFPIDTLGNVTSHNLSIDTSMGFAYVENSNSDPMSIFDLSDPESPTYVSSFGDRNIHDIYARNDTLYSADALSGTFTIWDMSDKFNPAIMARVQIPVTGYVHNIWPTKDGKYVVTTMEITNRNVMI